MNLKKENLYFRLVKKEDAENLLNIYEYYVKNTTVTFEYEVPTIEEFENRIEKIYKNYPYIVCEKDNKIIGYVYAHRSMERAAYQWNVELAIYIDKEKVGLGIGKILYEKIIEILKLQNVINIYACVTRPNEKSEKFHSNYGFKELGVFKNTGYKFEKWIDVVWYEKNILEHKLNPERVIKISEIEKEKIKEILKK